MVGNCHAAIGRVQISLSRFVFFVDGTPVFVLTCFNGPPRALGRGASSS